MRTKGALTALILTSLFAAVSSLLLAARAIAGGGLKVMSGRVNPPAAACPRGSCHLAPSAFGPLPGANPGAVEPLAGGRAGPGLSDALLSVVRNAVLSSAGGT